MITLRLSRSSASAGDDAEDHYREIIIDDPTTLEAAINYVLSLHYLPTVSGGATWSVWTTWTGTRTPIAVVAQGATAPKMMMRAAMIDLAERTGVDLEFIYHRQLAAETVYEVLRPVGSA